MGLREQLQSIYDTRGKLTPDIVVEEARDKGHELHSQVFDKNKTDAAEAYYRERAHDLIQSVKISYTAPSGRKDKIRAWVAVPREDGYSYEPTEDVVRDEFTHKLVVEEMKREWKHLKGRYEQFEEFWQILRDAVA